MVFNQLCPPALIYLIFSTTQVIIDSVKGLYNTALMKIWVAILFTILLNYLCSLGLGTISWLIVFIPFILMTLVVAVLLLMFGLDPSTGKLKMEQQDSHKHHKHGAEDNNTHSHGDGDHIDPDVNTSQKTDTNNLGYSNSNEKSVGNSKTQDAKPESKQEKTDKILKRSILFYQEDVPRKDGMLAKKKGGEDLKGATSVSGDVSSFDSNYVKLFIEDMTNLLYGMQEHEIASWYKTTALECINNLEGTTKEKEEKVINCLSEARTAMLGKFTDPQKRNLLENNILHRYCPDAKSDSECGEAVKKNWLKFE